MKKRIIGIFATLAMASSMFVMPVANATAVGTTYDFEGVNGTDNAAINEKYPGFVGAGTTGTVSVGSETNGNYTNKFLSYETTKQQLVTGITLEEGKNVISMRLKFDKKAAEIMYLRSNSGTSNTYVLVGRTDGNIRLLNDGQVSMSDLNTGKWYNYSMVVDTENKTIDQYLSEEGSSKWVTRQFTFTGDNDKNNLVAGSAIRFGTEGNTVAGTICVDDIKVSTVNDKRYLVKENFEQFSTGAMSSNFSHFMMNFTQENMASAAGDASNKYLALKGGTGGLVHNVWLYTGTQVWEMDLKVGPNTDSARVFLHGAGTNNTIIYRTDGVGKRVQIFGTDITNGAELANKLNTDFVKFTMIITRDGTNPISAKVYADGELLAEKTDLAAGFSNIRFDLNAIAGATTPADAEMYIDNLGCYIPGTSTFTATYPEANVERDDAKVTITSNNIIDYETIKAITIDNDATIIPVKNADGTSYELTFSGLKGETEYTLNGTVKDIYGQTLGTVDTSFTTNKVYRTKTVYVSKNGNDANAGTLESPKKSIVEAANIDDTKEIVVKDEITEKIDGIGNVSIVGLDSAAKLTVATSGFVGDITIDDIILNPTSDGQIFFANGNKLTIGDGVTTTADDKFMIFGGNIQANGELTGNTDITVLGGKYSTIYGGGNKTAVTGNTNVVIGGTATVDSVYGGGQQATVGGTSTVEIKDNATVTADVVGSGNVSTYQSANALIKVNGGTITNNIRGNASGINTVVCNSSNWNDIGVKFGDLSAWDYTVTATTGGTVTATGLNTITVTPDEGKIAVVNDKKNTNTELTLTEGKTEVVFREDVLYYDDEITFYDDAEKGTKALINVYTPVENTLIMALAVYDAETGVLEQISYVPAELEAGTAATLATEPIKIADGKKVVAMFWDGDMEPQRNAKTK